MHKSLSIDTGARISTFEDKRTSSVSAARNVGPIITALAPYVPKEGTVLELASGTGEHAVAFAKTYPNLTIQPTEVDQDRFESIDAWRKHEDLANMKSPMLLDATKSPWPKSVGDADFILLVNLLHLINKSECITLLTEAANTVRAGGSLAVYGPFKRGDGFASDSDRDFHQKLVSQDPEIGYKSVDFIGEVLAKAGLKKLAVEAMPANNLLLIARHS